MNITRRQFLQSFSCGVTAALLPSKLFSNQAASSVFTLAAATAKAPIAQGFAPDTEVWAYNQQVPGPTLRYQQGDTLRVKLDNQIADPTTIHWHGLRVPVEMDGVPEISQPAVESGSSFLYEFKLEDAGTFWYHPHFNSSEQIGKGLHGVLIVEELEAPQCDRDVVWVLDDWRLNENAEIYSFLETRHDASHNGRIGNVVTINGTIEETFAVYPGERIRLRLVNVANARVFSLRFDHLSPWLIALDGHPTALHQIRNEVINLGPGQRADLIVDIPLKSEEELKVIDLSYGQRFSYLLLDLKYDHSKTFTPQNNPPAALTPNPIAKPDLQHAVRHRIEIQGGAMSQFSGGSLDGKFMNFRELVKLGKFWAVNGVVASGSHLESPILNLSLGQSYIFEIVNSTAFEHPMHIHGHSFYILGTNDKPPPYTSIRDTVLVPAGGKSEIAFVADNPGLWMFHCHVPEHQESGMTSLLEVA